MTIRAKACSVCDGIDYPSMINGPPEYCKVCEGRRYRELEEYFNAVKELSILEQAKHAERWIATLLPLFKPYESHTFGLLGLNDEVLDKVRVEIKKNREKKDDVS